jgi:hypothetical protein
MSDGLSVLMDNTTVHGAVAAYSDWPPAPAAWRSNPHAVNLRSLMDIIEAIVLFEEISLDIACNSLAPPAPDEGVYDTSHSWEPFQSLRDINTREPVFRLEMFSAERPVIGGGILATAAERLEVSIKDGTIQQQAHLFRSDQIELAVPEFYTSPKQFMELLDESFEPEAIRSVRKEMLSLENMLLRQSGEVANFAMFAFRGFYYDELAHLLSISYIPHSFRSGVLSRNAYANRASFAQITLETVSGLRRDYIEQIGSQLSAQLNGELHGPALRAEFPLIASYVAGQATHRSDLMRVALDVRNSPAARRFRQWVIKVQSAIDEQAHLRVVGEAAQELEDLSRDLRRELHIKGEPNTPINVKLAAPGGLVGVDVPVNIQPGLPAWLVRVFRRRPHLKFLRDLALSGVEFAPFELRYRALRT